MTTRLIANKYREGKVKRTLKRELKVLEIVKGEANVAVECSFVWIELASTPLRVIEGNQMPTKLEVILSWFHAALGSTNVQA